MYDVTTDGQSQPEIDALPAVALSSFAEARAALELAPWNGEPFNESYPQAPVRSLVFGPDRQGMITFLIVEDLRRVDILTVLWLG